jgi:hypothetical protein
LEFTNNKFRLSYTINLKKQTKQGNKGVMYQMIDIKFKIDRVTKPKEKIERKISFTFQDPFFKEKNELTWKK